LNPGGGWEFFSDTASRPALEPNQPPIQWVPGALSLGVKQPRQEADHSLPSNAEVKECKAIPPLPQHAFMAWCSVKALEQLYLLHISRNSRELLTLIGRQYLTQSYYRMLVCSCRMEYSVGRTYFMQFFYTLLLFYNVKPVPHKTLSAIEKGIIKMGCFDRSETVLHCKLQKPLLHLVPQCSVSKSSAH
jgi:hypothetical protein